MSKTWILYLVSLSPVLYVQNVVWPSAVFVFSLGFDPVGRTFSYLSRVPSYYVVKCLTLVYDFDVCFQNEARLQIL